MTTATHPGIDTIREAFPALGHGHIHLENAGGSQVPLIVADEIRRYMLEQYVQLGAGYPLSESSDAVINGAHAFVETLMNAGPAGRVILGPSCTALMNMLAAAYARRLEPGDEVIIVETGHEANVGPWANLERHGLVVRTWRLDPATQQCRIEDLEALINERTKLAAVIHVSNLLGEIVDLAPAIERLHAVGARVIVDGVAYAPHRAIDVQALDADWYVYSTYKVYGPHMAALYGRHDAIAELEHPNHFFITSDDIPYAFEPGGVNHEGCAGVLALSEYLQFLTGADGEGPDIDRATVTRAFDVMTQLELPLQKRLIEGLLELPGVQLVGPAATDASRVGTVSFTHERVNPRAIVAVAHERGIGIRHGHMYAHRLCTALGIAPDPGVVRISLVHYNTMDEIEAVLDAVRAAVS